MARRKKQLQCPDCGRKFRVRDLVTNEDIEKAKEILEAPDNLVEGIFPFGLGMFIEIAVKLGLPTALGLLGKEVVKLKVPAGQGGSIPVDGEVETGAKYNARKSTWKLNPRKTGTRE